MPPKDELLVRAIADACGRDPDPLVLAARAARNPESILREISQLVAPLIHEAVQTEEELIDRLAVVSGVPANAITVALQALKSVSRRRGGTPMLRDQHEEE